MTSEQSDVAQILSAALGREVALAETRHDGESGATAEEYWPDMDGLEHRDTVTEWELPEGTFFDLAVVHLLTTATIDRLRELYPQGRFEARRFRPNIVVSTGEDARGFVENGPLPSLRHDHAGAGRPTEGRRHPAHGCAAQRSERGCLRGGGACRLGSTGR